MQRGFGDSRNADSDHGTRIHAALATGDGEELDHKQADLVESCEKIVDKVGAAYFGEEWPRVKARTFNEERYWIKFKYKDGDREGILQHSGQADRVYRAGHKALVCDFKSLGGEVADSPKNLQLRDLAVLVRGHFVVDEVATVIIQPLVTHSPELCIYDGDDLMRAHQEMCVRIVASNNPTANRVAGEAQCKYCRAKTACPEYQKWAAAMLPAPVSLLQVPMAQWTPQQCAQFLSGEAIARKYLDEGRDHCKTRLEADPDAIPGFRLGDGSKRETVTDPQALFDRFSTLKSEKEWKIEELLRLYMECVAVGKTKFEKAVNAVTGKKGKALKELIRTLFDGIVETKTSAKTIVRKDIK